jgi:hypothetical protein
MTNITQNALEKDELNILREQMLRPEELFLLQYLKNTNRQASQQLRVVYEEDTENE